MTMKKLMFYCQHILGIGHLVRSMEIVRGLTEDFQIYFINGGEIIKDFQVPPGVEIINLPAVKTDSEFQALQVPAGFDSIDALLEHRRDLLLNILEQVQPDVLMIELFPFGRRRFSTELIPLLEQAKANGTQTVCSLRDIVVTKQDQVRHEEKVCKLMNRHFDLLLIHGDPYFMPLETSFSRVRDLTCKVYYTGYVVQQEREVPFHGADHSQPTILVSVGGGRFGHELLHCVAEASAILEDLIPHHIQMFTGPFSPDAVLEQLETIATLRSNLTVDRYTPNLLQYMRQADLSISMAGYNTTMNILTTGTRALLLPFTGNDDQEQRIRSERLEELGIVQVIRQPDLQPERFAEKVVQALQQKPADVDFDLDGVEKTALLIRSLIPQPVVA
jgi:predicted glycosyltransferase